MSHPGPESTLTTYTASDGENLAVQDWHLSYGVRPRALVLLVHGLGEHAGRYDGLARLLSHWGFLVRGYDHYGHGQSGGTRGALPQPHRLLDDLADLVESTRSRSPGLPLVLLGHSLGGLVAAGLVARGIAPVDGLVLSSPALAPRLNPLQKLLLAVVPRVAPDLTVGNGLDPRYLSHDPEVVQAYRDDPLVHDRISGRLARFIADEGALVRSCAPRWSVPTLLLFAGDDHMVDPKGSKVFAKAAPRNMVGAHCFAGAYHEVFNEAGAQPVFSHLQQWLDARF
ncbi:alpha/beta hydrolase [Ramlibacter monticola]|uniref:Lysophospholipase n=1 Tax=Ramlibacter monticola TaxID=1926872 RepID=A0A937CVQ1_9BURK|nr:alpha/beta hydrolase [Ramlibacter monticola]MBL0394636.1 lysophospholipase [Ramlibacter monticola]